MADALGHAATGCLDSMGPGLSRPLNPGLVACSTEANTVSTKYRFGKADFLELSYLAKGLRAAESVARLRRQGQPGWMANGATAFLVGPELLLTNHHVLQTKEMARRYQADFEQVELGERSTRVMASFALDPERCFITDPDLDYALVAVAPRSSDGVELRRQGWLRLRAGLRLNPGDSVAIIQHPLGASKRVTLRENKVVTLSNPAASGLENMATRLWYLCDTAGGTSGAPVFDDAWRVVALHSGELFRDPDFPPVEVVSGANGGELPQPENPNILANEGVVIGAILEDLQRRMAGSPNALASALLEDDSAYSEAFGGHLVYSGGSRLAG